MPESRRITIIQGHPDPEPVHLCHALADAYARGAASGGHDVRRLKVAMLGLCKALGFTRANVEGEPNIVRVSLVL